MKWISYLWILGLSECSWCFPEDWIGGRWVRVKSGRERRRKLHIVLFLRGGSRTFRTIWQLLFPWADSPTLYFISEVQSVKSYSIWPQKEVWDCWLVCTRCPLSFLHLHHPSLRIALPRWQGMHFHPPPSMHAYEGIGTISQDQGWASRTSLAVLWLLYSWFWLWISCTTNIKLPKLSFWPGLDH